MTSAPVEVPEAFRADLRRRLGRVPDSLLPYASAPWIAHGILHFHSRPYHHAPRALLELAHLIVSRDNSCRYCYGDQRAYLRLTGLTDEAIDQLEYRAQAEDLPERERAAVELARRVSRCVPPPLASDARSLHKLGYSPAAVAELVFQVGLSHFINRVTTLTATGESPLARATSSWLGRVALPLVRWRVSRRMPGPQPLERPGAGVAEDVAGALGPTRAADVVRSLVAGAFASPGLAPRARALVFAVTGRALGVAPVSGVTRLLEEGGLSGAVQEAVLAHLHSPALSAFEGRLVAFAREAVRYRPDQLRASLRRLTELGSAVEGLEAVGTVALANAVSRMAVLR